MARLKAKAGRIIDQPKSDTSTSAEPLPPKQPSSPKNPSPSDGRKRKASPPLHIAKKHQTGWTRFFADVCKGLGHKDFDFGHDFTEISQFAAAWWKDMTHDERAPYITDAKLERENFKVKQDMQSKKRPLPVAFGTRCSPKMVVGVSTGIAANKKKVAAVKSMGFGFATEFRCQHLPREFMPVLLERFDPKLRTLQVAGSDPIVVTEADVGIILGVPSEGQRVPREVDKEKMQVLHSQIQSASLKALRDVVVNGVADSSFKPTFLLLLLGCFLCPTTKDVASPRLMPAISVAATAHKYNWAEFILEWLITEVKKYKCTKTNRLSSGGCLFFLMILYFNRVPLGVTPNHAGSYVISAWDDNNVCERVQMEMSSIPKRQWPQSKYKGSNDALKGGLPVFKNPAIQAVYDCIHSEAQEMLVAFTHVVEGQLRTVDALCGESAVGQTAPVTPPLQSVSVTPIIREFSPIVRDFFKQSFGSISPKNSTLSPPAYGQRARRVTQPGPQQQSPYISMPHIVITQLTSEETAVWRYCTRRPTRKDKQKMLNILHVGAKTPVDHDDFASSMGPRGWVSTLVVLSASSLMMTRPSNIIEVKGKMQRRRLIMHPEFAFYIDLWGKKKSNFSINQLEYHYRDDCFDGSNIAKAELIFVPVIRLSHWYSIVINLRDKRIDLLDSRLECLDEESMVFVRRVRDVMNKILSASSYKNSLLEFPIVPQPVPQQEDDNNSCGIFMLKYFECWDGRLTSSFSLEHIENIRKRFVVDWVLDPLNKQRDIVLDRVRGPKE